MIAALRVQDRRSMGSRRCHRHRRHRRLSLNIDANVHFTTTTASSQVTRAASSLLLLPAFEEEEVEGDEAAV